MPLDPMNRPALSSRASSLQSASSVAAERSPASSTHRGRSRKGKEVVYPQDSGPVIPTRSSSLTRHSFRKVRPVTPPAIPPAPVDTFVMVSAASTPPPAVVIPSLRRDSQATSVSVSVSTRRSSGLFSVDDDRVSSPPTTVGSYREEECDSNPDTEVSFTSLREALDLFPPPPPHRVWLNPPPFPPPTYPLPPLPTPMDRNPSDSGESWTSAKSHVSS